MNDALEAFKFACRQIRKATGCKITLAQEELARTLNYKNFHEARTRLLDQRAEQVRTDIAKARALVVKRLQA
uniref:Uncharacterized protein n=1 Tax=Pseudomonas phage HRDY3 TaxID=3236930 RepID=A0AB39CDJ6_9VIRU